MGNIREKIIGLGKAYQGALQTGNTVGNIWRFNKLNASFLDPNLITENDAAEIGKGHEFATEVFKSHWDVAGQIEKYCSSEWMAWVLSFALGVSVKTGTGPYTYTIDPLDPPTDGLDLPAFSVVEQIRPGASVIVDRILIGCVIEGWTLSIGTGPGRENAKLVADIVGCGKYTSPSSISIPAKTAENYLAAASLSATINGVNYVTSKNLVSLEASWRNNVRLDSGFYPGSGFQTPADGTTGAIRGRMEVGDRQLGLQFVARFENGSTELSDLLAQTSGTAVIGLTLDADNNATLTYQKVQFQSAVLGESDGIVTVQVVCLPMWHSSNDLFQAVVDTEVDGICQAEV